MKDYELDIREKLLSRIEAMTGIQDDGWCALGTESLARLLERLERAEWLLSPSDRWRYGEWVIVQ